VATAFVWYRDELWFRVQGLLVSGILRGGFLWVLGVEWGDRFLLFNRKSSFLFYFWSLSVYRDELKFGVDGFVTSILSSAFLWNSHLRVWWAWKALIVFYFKYH
jgi:hypothetical protein